MFERRLKIFLGVVIVLTLVVLARAAQLQLTQHDKWELKAYEKSVYTEHPSAARGTILDFKGQVMVEDAACIDAAVEYRAMAKDPRWIRELLNKRLSDAKEGRNTRAERAQFLASEAQRISDEIDVMWQTLADVSGQNLEDIAELRNDILRKVETRRWQACHRPYEQALRKYQENVAQQEKAHHFWLVRWLMGGPGAPPQEQDFQFTIKEETESHVILHDISDSQCAELSKRLEHCPGLVLRKGTHRHAQEPANTVCAHVLGRLGNDGSGNSGMEKLFEHELHGTPGCVEYFADRADPVEISKSARGQIVRSSIDVHLNQQIQSSFQSVVVKVLVQRPDGSFKYDTPTREDLHGGWVVIDVPTGEVRSMGSYPTYDLNEFAAQYPALRDDLINRPLYNRATMDQLEPGSSVKVIIGSTALSKAFVGEHEGIECTGYLTLRNEQTGKMDLFKTQGRCWVQRQSNNPNGPALIHHAVGSYPHHGSFGNPDGFLTVTDALMRSCNVVFETIADRMGLEEVHDAMANFGLGRPTGIGIEESKGHIPDPANISPALRRMTACMAGIGEDQVLATPLQMANVAASLARDGQWIRPHLLTGQTPGPDDRRDLGLSVSALAAVRQGMIEVANTPGGTGLLEIDDLLVAGKTGTAQTSPLRIPLRDADGKPVLIDGVAQFETLKPGAFPWYQGVGDNQSMVHAWYIGYAPADHPRIAFAVLVEYGGSGGGIAGPIAKRLLEACQEDGYLPKTPGVCGPWKQPQ
jgi:penicillin-binding protein 2